MSNALSNNQAPNRISTPRSGVAASGLKRQAGMSFLGVFALISMLMFIGLFAMKVVPGYIDFMTVTKIAEDTQADTELMSSPKSKVMASIDAAYRQNNLWDLKSRDTITLTKDSQTGYKLVIDYEQRQNLISNIFVVTSFNKDLSQP